MRSARHRTGWLALAAMLGAASTAAGQSTRPAEPPSSRPAPGGLLAGPTVSEAARSAPAGGRDRATLPARRWLALVMRLDLDAAQRTRVRAIVAELGDARRGFRREHGGEADELRRRLREARRDDAPPSPELVRRLRAVEARAPRVVAYQQRIWNELTPVQQDDLRRAVAAARAARSRGGALPGEAMDDSTDEATDDATALPPGLDEAGRRRLRFLLRRRAGGG